MADDFSLNITPREKYGALLDIQTVEAAQAYLTACVKHRMKVSPEMTESQAKETEKRNIGYYIGYFNKEQRARLYDLFDVIHPVYSKKV